jgi:hypothetical protein
MYFRSSPLLQQYTSNYHTYTYKAKRYRTCPYSIIPFSVTGYVVLTGFHKFNPLPTRHIIKSTIAITDLKTTYRSMMTESTDINRFIIRLITMMAAENSSGTNSRTRRVTGDDDNHYDSRLPLLNPANERNRIRSRC